MADYTHFDAGTFAKWLFTKIKGLLSGYVKTTDSRLSDARKASDVSAWAKASTKPTYTAAEVGAAAKDGTNATGTWGISISGKAATADSANNVAWANTNHPETFPPSSHTHNTIYLPDTRNANQAPSWYYSNYGKQVIVEFKTSTAVGLSGFPTYCALVTVVPWIDSSGGNVVQRAVNYSDNKEYVRSGSGASWGAWTAMDTTGSAKSVTSTLLASRWSGSSAPYTYDIGSAYSGKSVAIGYDATKYTESSAAAARDADIVGGEGTVIYAYGEKPSVDIPIIIQYS